MTTAMTTAIIVTPVGSHSEADRESGDALVYQRFTVQRPGRPAHTVTVEVSPDSGTPQGERCDCSGYRYRQTCTHITAVYDAGVLGCEWE